MTRSLTLRAAQIRYEALNSETPMVDLLNLSFFEAYTYLRRATQSDSTNGVETPGLYFHTVDIASLNLASPKQRVRGFSLSKDLQTRVLLFYRLGCENSG